MSATTTSTRLSLSTGFGAHKIPNQIALEARRRGFSVEHHHDGGRWTRDHLITITGDPVKVRNFVTAARSAWPDV